MLEDLRYALRQLRKNPGFAALAVATLGFGIGAAAAMFGLIQGVLLSPPPYAEPDRLVLLASGTARRSALHGTAYDRALGCVAPGSCVRGSGRVSVELQLPGPGRRE